jgi:hypothetical protein
MEQVIIMRNYGLDIQAAILEALLKCHNNATDLYSTEHCKTKYKCQLNALKQLQSITEAITQQINEI